MSRHRFERRPARWTRSDWPRLRGILEGTNLAETFGESDFVAELTGEPVVPLENRNLGCVVLALPRNDRQLSVVPRRRTPLFGAGLVFQCIDQVMQERLRAVDVARALPRLHGADPLGVVLTFVHACPAHASGSHE